MACKILNKLAENDCAVDLIGKINGNAILYSQQCTGQFQNRAVIKVNQHLKANNLVAVPFEKGLGCCLLYKTTSVSKVQQLTSGHQFELLDVTKCRKNANEVFIVEENRFKTELSVLRRSDLLSEDLYMKFCSTGGHVARLYGCTVWLKHKNNTPLRAILSMPGSCYQNLSVT